MAIATKLFIHKHNTQVKTIMRGRDSGEDSRQGYGGDRHFQIETWQKQRFPKMDIAKTGF